jgi:hypothetical protein
MLRAKLRCAVLVAVMATAMLATDAHAGDGGRFCPCADRYSQCMQDGKGERYCDTQNQKCVWNECRR